MYPMERLWKNDTRTVAGLMSGTSLDGVDAVIVRISGHGRGMQLEQLAFCSVPYSEELRAILLKNSAPESSSVRDISQLNFRISYEYAEALRRAVAEAGLKMSDLDLIGSHGQTIHHVPQVTQCAGVPITSTLQIGDPSVLANLTGVPVVGDFRVSDMALGGQGAPLVPYFDYVYFTHESEYRGLLNIGGIANITVLPAQAAREDVFAFDTGPGNMILDLLAYRFYREPCDRDGRHAAAGSIQEELLAELLMDPYFVQEPPKSTGREYFGEIYIDRMLNLASERRMELTPEDWMSTATALTAFSVYQAYARYIRPFITLDVLIVSGGGMHNPFLMEKLVSSFAPIPVRTVEDYGMDSDAKEALCFAVLAHETAAGIPTNLPGVTGAERETILGKICLPL